MRKDILVLGVIALVAIVAAVVVSNSYRSSVANERVTSNANPAAVNSLFRKYATELGLDMGRMDAVFAGNRYAAKVDRDKKDGQSLGVKQTPTIFVNGRKLLRLNEADFKVLIDEELGN